jgi:capsular polysaccharide export protein
MSKLTKLLRSPRAFVNDALDKRWPTRRLQHRIHEANASGKPTAILIGFSDWKTWMRDVLPDQHVVFLGHSPRVDPLLLASIPAFHKPTVYVWSYKFPPELRRICAEHRIPIHFVEDGFVRGFGLGVAKTKPMSLAFDGKGMHFDRNTVTDLDALLNAEGPLPDTAMAASTQVMDAIRNGVTKYMGLTKRTDLTDALMLDPDRRTILVLGQVEDDLSIAYGMEGFMSGNDLVARVALANPDAHILYRPHPESLAVAKKHYSNPKDVSHIAHVIGPEWSLKETFAAAHEAHAITSLAGLEAAVAGLEVHTYGTPFYAGWGFTTDHGLTHTPGKRTRTRTLEEVVAAAYVLYPRYFHPITCAPITALEAFELTSAMRGHMERIITVRTRRQERQAAQGNAGIEAGVEASTQTVALESDPAKAG